MVMHRRDRKADGQYRESYNYREQPSFWGTIEPVVQSGRYVYT